VNCDTFKDEIKDLQAQIGELRRIDAENKTRIAEYEATRSEKSETGISRRSSSDYVHIPVDVDDHDDDLIEDSGVSQNPAQIPTLPQDTSGVPINASNASGATALTMDSLAELEDVQDDEGLPAQRDFNRQPPRHGMQKTGNRIRVNPYSVIGPSRFLDPR